MADDGWIANRIAEVEAELARFQNAVAKGLCECAAYRERAARLSEGFCPHTAVATMRRIEGKHGTD